MKPAEEARLIGEARRGAVDAFEDLVRRYDADVLRLALRVLRTEEDARDVYQEAFLKAYRSMGQFRGECSFRTWLYRIVVNLCRDHARRRQAARRDGRLVPLESERGDGWTVEAARLLVDRRPASDPDRVLESREVRRRVGEALALLPERERLVFELRHEQGMRVSAIAEVLETTDETVRNCLYRAHQRLRTSLADLRRTATDGPGGAAAAGGGTNSGVTGRRAPLNGVD